MIALIAIQRSDVQNWLAQKAVAALEKKLGTTVAVKKVDIGFFNKLNLHGFLLKDEQKDTLVYAGNLQLKVSDFIIYKKSKPIISYIGLEDAYVNLYRCDDSTKYNYDFISEKLFPPTVEKEKVIANEPEKKSATKGTGQEFDLKKIVLKNVRVKSIDTWFGQNLIAHVGNFTGKISNFNTTTKVVDLDGIDLKNTHIAFADYQGKKPYKAKNDTIDTTPFNPDDWKINLSNFDFEAGSFSYQRNFHVSTPGLFDERHIDAKDINISLKDIAINKDTLIAQLKNISLKERSGFEIKKLQAQLSLSPIKTSLKNLELVTNRSQLKNSYEMHYQRFPDFNDYIEKVKMKAALVESHVDIRDIAYFGPGILNLSFQKCIIKNAKVEGTVTDLRCEAIDIKVGNSEVKGNLSMKGLPDINKTFIQFTNGQLITTGKELVQLVPAVKNKAINWNTVSKVNYQGAFKGYIDNFFVDGLLTTNLGKIQSNINLQLPKGGEPVYTGTIDAQEFKLRQLIPGQPIEILTLKGDISGKSFDLKKLNSTFKGTVREIRTPDYAFTNVQIDGRVQDQIFEGKILSRDPNINVDFDGLFDFNMDKPDAQRKYKGNITTRNLQLSNFIKSPPVDNITLQGRVDGAGYDLKNINANFEGLVASIKTPTYTFQKIKINGNVNGKKFDGIIKADDPNLAMDFNGKFDFSSPTPIYKLKTKLVRFDLKALGITSEPISGSAYMDLNFNGSNLENFNGTAQLYQVHLENRDKIVNLDSALLKSITDGKNRTLDLKSSAADAYIAGEFKLNDIYKGVQLYLANYLPSYITRPSNVPLQKFDYELHTKDIGPLLETFLPDLKGCNNLNASGKLDMYSKAFVLNLDAPNFSYQKLTMNDIHLTSVGDNNALQLNANLGNILSDNKLIIPSAIVSSTLGEDTAVLNIKSASDEFQVKDAELQVKGFAQNKKLFVQVLPSSFYFKDGKWDLYSTDYVVIDGKNIYANKLMLSNGNQKIALKTTGDSNQHVEAIVQEINLHDVANFIDTSIEIKGFATGKLVLNNYATKRFYSGDIETSELVYGKDSIGKLTADLDFDEEAKVIRIGEKSGLTYQGNFTPFSGIIDIKPAVPTLDLEATANGVPVKLLESLWGNFISNTTGTASGDMKVTGPVDNYYLDGELDIKDVKSKINYLGVTYSIPTGKVIITSDLIDFGKTTLYDELGNQAKLVGNITHHNFTDIIFDIQINSNKKPFLFLKTTELDNDLYYGTIIASGVVNITDRVDDIKMDVMGTTQKGTNLTLPIKSSFNGGTYDYISFKNRGLTAADSLLATKKKISDSKFNLDILLKATPDAKMSIVLDPTTGEEIKGVGEGDINMKIDLDNTFAMSGEYVITEGQYVFGFRNLLKKEIDIQPGGTIVWERDPLKAKLNLVATYSKTIPILPLLDASQLSSAELVQARTPIPTNVNILLKGEMLAPDISFNIEQPSNNDINNPAYKELMALRANPSELLTQSIYVIFLNGFRGRNSAINVQGSLLNNASDLVSSTLSSIVSNIIKVKNLDVNIIYQNINDLSSSTDQLKFGGSYKTDRWAVTINNNVNHYRGAAAGQKTQASLAATNFDIQYLVTPDGRFRISAFRNSFTDPVSGNNAQTNNKGGVGLLYRKSFNSFSMKNIAPMSYDNSDTVPQETMLNDSTRKEGKGSD